MKKISVFILAASVGVSACGGDESSQLELLEIPAWLPPLDVRPMPEDEFEWIADGREVKSTQRIERQASDVVWLTLPEGVPYSLMSPTAVAIEGPPHCRVAVADSKDEAVHLFDHEGTYGSTLIDTTSQSATREIKSVSFGPNGTLATAELTHQQLTVFDGSFNVLWRASLALDRGFAAQSNIVALGDGTVAEHWLGSTVRTSGSWSQGLPKIRVFGPDGTGHILALANINDQVGDLNVWLNKGTLFSLEGSLWFGRAIDGRLIRFDGGQGIVEVTPPMLFDPRRPLELVEPSENEVVGVLADFQLWDVTPVADDGFILIQTTSFPEGEAMFRPGYWPKMIVTAVDRTGKGIGVMRVPGEPLEIRASGNRVVGLVSDSVGLHAVLFTVPFFPQSSPECQ